MKWINKHINKSTSIAPLATFRMLFGLVMLISTIRFIAKGWINQLYIEPTFLFPFVDFIQPLNSTGMHALFITMAICSIGIMLGYFYRFSIVVFFLCFTYVELLDKSNYLNHYYFVSVVSFLMIWLPANKAYSIDVIRKPLSELKKIPAWCVNILKLQIGIVYFYAGLAKLNVDWLVHALPLKIWLPAKTDLPLIGDLLQYEWMAYAFSWTGAIYDLFIPFLLLYKKTRPFAFAAVVVFHLLTRALFPIGMFPYIMIASSLIFFSADWHLKLFNMLRFNNNKQKIIAFNKPIINSRAFAYILIPFMALQLLLPWRYTLYDGNLFWTEQGYRFSWRVMLMEKAGHATFFVKNPDNQIEVPVNLQNYLQPHQEKQMAFQPDMLLQFAHFIEEEYKTKGIENPAVRVEAYVALNGRKSQLIIDPSIDLTKENNNLKQKKWLLPLAELK